jgi:hypothetical protein
MALPSALSFELSVRVAASVRLAVDLASVTFVELPLQGRGMGRCRISPTQTGRQYQKYRR